MKTGKLQKVRTRFPEDDLQMAVAKYLDSIGVLWCHVANERKTSPQAGARLKKKGVKSGVPDCLIFEPRSDHNGLAIELKVDKNKPTDNQRKWLNALGYNNWYTAVCYSIDEVKEVVEKYYK